MTRWHLMTGCLRDFYYHETYHNRDTSVTIMNDIHVHEYPRTTVEKKDDGIASARLTPSTCVLLDQCTQKTCKSHWAEDFSRTAAQYFLHSVSRLE